MRRTVAFLAATLALATTSVAYALYSVSEEGLWPATWPKELESLRKGSRTLEGPTISSLHYEIPFDDRDVFEAAWPHLVKLKSEGAPVFLRSAPSVNVYDLTAGVIIHTPPRGTDQRANPERPIRGWDRHEQSTWMWTSYIELVVDGEIVDLNRIPLPPDTPIIDRRFDGQQG